MSTITVATIFTRMTVTFAQCSFVSHPYQIPLTRTVSLYWVKESSTATLPFAPGALAQAANSARD